MLQSSNVFTNREHYQEKFYQLLHAEEFNKVKELLNDHISWDVLTWKIYDDNSFLAEIIRVNNIELVDYCINLPKYKSHPQYLSEMSYYIAYGFEKSAAGEDVNALQYYENLHSDLNMNSINNAGLNRATLEKENGKEVMRRYLFRDALYNAIDSEYSEGDIIDFILSIKDKYGAEDCKLTVSDMIVQLDEESLHSNKAETIKQHLGYEYDNRLFKDVYNIVKNDPRLHPSIVFLVLEKNIEFTPEIKQLIQGDIRVENVFLHRKLEEHVEIKNVGNKIKI